MNQGEVNSKPPSKLGPHTLLPLLKAIGLFGGTLVRAVSVLWTIMNETLSSESKGVYLKLRVCNE